ncbi:MAG: hypothetical protein LBG97_10585 [Coriobacteriales bacterium]|jgi:cell fate regulator YaaT (PSP1 superfamily)|nr:hypothetical protein [Coriobacteriales bacterium]
MPTVTVVKLRNNPKPLWFNPQGKTYNTGDYVLVETERGREAGQVVNGSIQVTDDQISKLKSKLKPVVRDLSDIDFDHMKALEEKGKEAMPVFRELAEKHELDIKPVEVEYLFSGDKAVFYFASEERVDFRELVRDLASHFHVRVDMRQIGGRDEARMLGGLAHCGEELCCKRLGGEFQPVSIRMAKEQDLPLNPAKISGACGRLMCCLRYEFEAYKDFKQRAPKRGTLVNTPLGDAKVTDFDTPRELINMQFDDGKRLQIPLCEMDCKKDAKGCDHCKVSREVIDRCASPSVLLALGALDRESDLFDDSVLVASSDLYASGYDDDNDLDDISLYEDNFGGDTSRSLGRKLRRRHSLGQPSAHDAASGSEIKSNYVEKSSDDGASGVNDGQSGGGLIGRGGIRDAEGNGDRGGFRGGHSAARDDGDRGGFRGGRKERRRSAAGKNNKNQVLQQGAKGLGRGGAKNIAYNDAQQGRSRRTTHDGVYESGERGEQRGSQRANKKDAFKGTQKRAQDSTLQSPRPRPGHRSSGLRNPSQQPTEPRGVFRTRPKSNAGLSSGNGLENDAPGVQRDRTRRRRRQRD